MLAELLKLNLGMGTAKMNSAELLILSPERGDCTLGVILFLAGLSNQGQVVVEQILDTLCPRLWLAGLSNQG